MDIVQAFRKFLTTCDPAYREEAVYAAARQLLWNMTQSRPLFLPDFIAFLHEFEADFRLNPYLRQDKEAGKLLDYLETPVLPDTLVCAHCRRELPTELLRAVKEHFPHARVVEPDESCSPGRRCRKTCARPRSRAIGSMWRSICPCCAVGGGGIALSPEALPSLLLKRRRMEKAFFGFENQEDLTTLCFGAAPHHYVIRALLDSYREEHLYNRAFLPLAERLRDFLITRFHLKPNGRRQVLEGDVVVHLQRAGL